MILGYADALYELAFFCFSLSFFLLAAMCVVCVVWVGMTLYKWAASGSLTSLTKGVFAVDNRSGVITPTEYDSWQIDRQTERDENARRG